MKNEQNKIILITGANRGIGLEIAIQLAEAHHTVIIGSRDLEKGQNAVKSIGGHIHVIKMDVTEPEEIRSAGKFIDQKFGKLDVLINNAGIGVGANGAVNADFDEVKKIMETNFYGPWYVIDYLLEWLFNSEDARIINISSGMGALKDLKGGYAGYRLSKSSLNALTILLSNELKEKNVKVNAVNPGWVQTDMGGPEAARTVSKGAETAVWLATADDIPTGKFFRDKIEIPF